MLGKALLLLLSSPICALAQSAADYYVKSIPGQPDGPLLKMHAGHIEVDAQTNGHLFFWHFQNRHIANRQRTIIWLNGGPGCSSMDGALMEIGPYRVKDDHTLVYNNGSWDEFANLLFIDQPVGTGFSYVNTNSFLHDLDHVSSHMVTFLDKWFAMFPEYESDDLYIAGESWAGQYIPHIARAIVARNKNIDSKQQPWVLKGLLIGNGWISPLDQYPATMQYAYAEGLVKEGSSTATSLDAMNDACAQKLADPGSQNMIRIGQCESVLDSLMRLTRTSEEECVNMYDIRLKDASCGRTWPPDLDPMTRYLQRTEVRSALNLDREQTNSWTECNDQVGFNLRLENPGVPAVHLLPDLIESGVKILLFSGDRDLICNHLGTEQLIHNMKWSGGTGFETKPGVWAPRRDWTFEGDAAGYYQQARNLTYVLFYNASHMVPYDWPRRTRDMVDRFINVDIANIGGTPADSRLDGEKLPQTSVGNTTSSTSESDQVDQEKLKDAEWKAYAKSGEAALIVVIIGVSVWGFFIWRARQRASRGSSPSKKGYRSVYPGGSNNTSSSDAATSKQEISMKQN
ncbi:pheromone processing carboxypeptidase KexA [Talaromyces stipitatus ATCC 10500]|uniref:Pheromone-processing carboxypeptidase KEX1 n=1 Tax=Talaromyces stipitatus (strain ATCC 10500 / CBS 375.48 / QM 6759 / NRRL 1006) TaxID=441959 RepID=B8M720_TALSN|nr:pheromone processing carboxypeptidase KexA [Talaromyces stipitatus ATCC 10500]EED20240.1 pheromone processing carboxypeptidase KexA [Talaromyces stipitatus ATCC 10500]